MNDKVYGIELEGTKKQGQTGIYRNIRAEDKYFVPNEEYPGTVFDGFIQACDSKGTSPMLGWRPRFSKSIFGPYKYLSYDEVKQRVLNLGSGLDQLAAQLSLSLDENGQYAVGILSVNRPEWIICDLSIMSRRLVTVALYDTYGESLLSYVIDHSEVQVVFVSLVRIVMLLKMIGRGELKGIKCLILLDSKVEREEAIIEVDSFDLIRQWCETYGINFLTLSELEKLGSSNPTPPRPPLPSDTYTLIYTSGTTGRPKAVVGTHFNYVSTFPSFCITMKAINMTEVSYLSFLPLAHCFDRSVIYCTIMKGGKVGFFSGDILRLIDDISSFQPTYLSMVPRLLNKLYSRINAVTNQPGFLPSLFRTGLQAKMTNYKDGLGTTHLVWDALVFSKIKAILGGKVQVIITGSAPISKEVLEFLRVTLCPIIIEGYGLTETSAGGCTTEWDENDAGTVGPPSIQSEVKLIDLPEMNYLTSDLPYPRGEILIRGASVFKKYYKDSEATQEAFDSEGFYKTGDVGLIDQLGRIKIIDRKKNLFKLSQGEYISPEKIENVLSSLDIVGQVMVYGDPLKSHLVAIIVPDEASFLDWVNQGKTDGVKLRLDEAYQNREVNKKLVDKLTEHSKSNALNGFELVKAVHLSSTPFTLENNMMTPTMKVKRKEAQLYYQSVLDQLYLSSL